MWFQGSDVAPPKITIQPTAFPEVPRDTATRRPLLSKLHGATDWVGAVVWELGINKGCSVKNLQLVFGHSGNTEIGRRGHESASQPRHWHVRSHETLAALCSERHPPFIFCMPLSGPSPGHPSPSTSEEQQAL